MILAFKQLNNQKEDVNIKNCTVIENEMGIYKITNIITKQMYIGSSKQIEIRWKEHIKDLQNGVHHSSKLQKSFDMYGEDYFKFDIIEIIENIDNLLTREQYWIDFCNSTSNENFNMTDALEGSKGKNSYINDFISLQKQECGNFIFFNYKYIEELIDLLNNYDLVRLFYIATYLNKGTYLMQTNNKTYINKIELKNIININDKSFRDFLKIVIDNSILIKSEDKYQLNPKYFYKGSKESYRKNIDKDINSFIKIYISPIKYIYTNIPSSSYTHFSTVLKMIPFINKYNNILCENIDENIKSKLKILYVTKFINAQQGSRFIKNLNKIQFNNECLLKVIPANNIINRQHVVINPRILYKGSDIQELVNLFNIFKNN